MGVFVEGSISTAAADAEHKLALKEAAFHRLLSELREVSTLISNHTKVFKVFFETPRLRSQTICKQLLIQKVILLILLTCHPTGLVGRRKRRSTGCSKGALREVFALTDVDGNGQLTLEEFTRMKDDERTSPLGVFSPSLLFG